MTTGEVMFYSRSNAPEWKVDINYKSTFCFGVYRRKKFFGFGYWKLVDTYTTLYQAQERMKTFANLPIYGERDNNNDGWSKRMNFDWVISIFFVGFFAFIIYTFSIIHTENKMKLNTHFKIECLKVGGSVVPIADTKNFSCIVGRDKV